MASWVCDYLAENRKKTLHTDIEDTDLRIVLMLALLEKYISYILR